MALTMEVVRASEMSVNFHQTFRRNFPEDIIHTRRCEDHKSHRKYTRLRQDKIFKREKETKTPDKGDGNVHD
jgi:hypothetical protein